MKTSVLLAIASMLAFVPTASAGTVAEPASCPSSSGPQSGVLVADLVCVANPYTKLPKVPPILKNISDTYVIWTQEEPLYYDNPDSEQCEPSPGPAVWSFSLPVGDRSGPEFMCVYGEDFLGISYQFNQTVILLSSV